MKVKVSENGIPNEINIEDIKIGELTLKQIYEKIVAAENDVKRIDEANKAREARLVKIWGKLK